MLQQVTELLVIEKLGSAEETMVNLDKTRRSSLNNQLYDYYTAGQKCSGFSEIENDPSSDIVKIRNS